MSHSEKQNIILQTRSYFCCCSDPISCCASVTFCLQESVKAARSTGSNEIQLKTSWIILEIINKRCLQPGPVEKSACRGGWVHLPSLDRCIYHSNETRYNLSAAGAECLEIRLKLLANISRPVSVYALRRVSEQDEECKQMILAVKCRPFYDPVISAAPWWQCVSVHVCAGGDLILYIYSVDVCFNFILLFICFLWFIIHL